MGQTKKIVISFDDGPDPSHTPALLKYLENQGVPACFFLIAQKAKRYAELSCELVERGFEIGNHSASHAWSTAFLPSALRQELDESEKIFKDLFGKIPRLYRPPRGILMPWMKKILHERSYQIVYWTDMPGDYWSWHSVEKIKKKLWEPSAKDLSIWTFHDGLNLWGSGKGLALDVLRELVPHYQQQGYRFVSVKEGLNLNLYK